MFAGLKAGWMNEHWQTEAFIIFCIKTTTTTTKKKHTHTQKHTLIQGNKGKMVKKDKREQKTTVCAKLEMKQQPEQKQQQQQQH